MITRNVWSLFAADVDDFVARRGFADRLQMPADVFSDLSPGLGWSCQTLAEQASHQGTRLPSLSVEIDGGNDCFDRIGEDRVPALAAAQLSGV